MGAKMKEYSSSQEEVVTEGKTNTQVDEIKNLKLNQLINFKDHPFKVETNTELFELMQSIEKDAAPWSNPSSLHSYFNKTINYVTELKTRQVVY